MIRVSARASATPQEMSDILSGRLLALATVHALVRRTFDCNRMANQGPDLHEIVSTILHPHDDVGVRFKIEGPPVRLVIDRNRRCPIRSKVVLLQFYNSKRDLREVPRVSMIALVPRRPCRSSRDFACLIPVSFKELCCFTLDCVAKGTDVLLHRWTAPALAAGLSIQACALWAAIDTTLMVRSPKQPRVFLDCERFRPVFKAGRWKHETARGIRARKPESARWGSFQRALLFSCTGLTGRNVEAGLRASRCVGATACRHATRNHCSDGALLVSQPH